jgi:VanZ family protein
MGTIFTASATPGNQLQNFGAWDLLVKKGGHFLGYLLLSMSFNFAIDADTPKNWAAAFSLAVLYAITDEIHQITTPGRHSSPVDVGIDSLGAAAGVGIWYWRWIHSAERKT